MRLTAMAFAVAAMAGAAVADDCAQGQSLNYAAGGGYCYAIATYGATSGPAGTLVVVLHGDLSSGGPATYHTDVAEQIAAAKPGVVSVALVRNGYEGPGGRQSSGSNHGRRDHYRPDYNAGIAAAIAGLKSRYGAQRVIAVGHSGGAAMVGAIIGRDPGLIDAAVLVSCPCDIDRWRRSRGRSEWALSEGPSDYDDRIPATTRVIAINGENDTNTRPSLARDYVEGLAARGVPASAIVVSGGGHNFSRLQGTVLETVKGLL